MLLDLGVINGAELGCAGHDGVCWDGAELYFVMPVCWEKKQSWHTAS